MRDIVLDTETTGLDPKSGDRLVEIGCVELVNMFPTGKVHHVYINPERSMPREAFAVHGLSDAFLADKPRFDDIADAFLDFIADSRLVIHNAQFDMGFINHELKKAGRVTIPDDRVLDTLALARRKHPGASASLDALCSRYGIDTSKRVKHGALLDAELLAEVYIELNGGRQADLGLVANSTRTQTGTGRIRKTRTRPVALPSRLSDEDRDTHRAFIKTLGANPVWLNYLDMPMEEAKDSASGK